MSEKNLRDHLEGFYAGQSLSSEKATWLRSLAQVDIAGAQGAGPRREVGRLSRAQYGFAACAVVLVLATAYYVFQDRSTPAGRVDWQRSIGAGDTTQSLPGGAKGFPRLVVVKVHADWCVRCPTIAPIFAGLSEEYGNQPVLFVTLDITDQKKRQQAQYLASAIGIGWAYDKSLESGTIKLLDREQGKVLARLTNPEQEPHMASALARALPRQP